MTCRYTISGIIMTKPKNKYIYSRDNFCLFPHFIVSLFLSTFNAKSLDPMNYEEICVGSDLSLYSFQRRWRPLTISNRRVCSNLFPMVELHQRVYLVFSFGTVLLDLISGEHIPPSHPYRKYCLRVDLTAIQEILSKIGYKELPMRSRFKCGQPRCRNLSFQRSKGT
ncbi:hypothetical protein AtNW77_Chr4g0285551 [Arabidopsis thaliana]